MPMSDLVPELSTTDFAELLLRLSPPGMAFGPNGRWEDLLQAVAVEYERHILRSRTACDESDPRTAEETLSRWESELGITDPQTVLGDRQAEAHAHLIATGGQSVAYYTEIAAALGVTITITEPLDLGWSPASPACYPMYAWTARYVWIVNGEAATVPSVRAALVSLFSLLKPEHTRVYHTWNA